jgi:hypothetical protein
MLYKKKAHVTTEFVVFDRLYSVISNTELLIIVQKSYQFPTYTSVYMLKKIIIIKRI